MSNTVNVDFVTQAIVIEADGKEYTAALATAADRAVNARREIETVAGANYQQVYNVCTQISGYAQTAATNATTAQQSATSAQQSKTAAENAAASIGVAERICTESRTAVETSAQAAETSAAEAKSYRDQAALIVTPEGLTTQVNTNTDNITDVVNDLNTIRTNEKWELISQAESYADGKYIDSDGTEKSSTSFRLYKFIPVQSNKLLYIFTSWGENGYSATGYNNAYSFRGITFYTSAKTRISSIYSYTRSPIQVPENAVYASVTIPFVDVATQNVGTVWITHRWQDDHVDRITVNPSEITGNNSNKILELYNTGMILSPRKPTFCFIFDDGSKGDENVKALFDEYGFKCGFALLYNAAISELISGNSTRMKYLGYQKDGYEILSHSINADAFNTLDVATANQNLKQSIEGLSSLGFNITGWVTPSSVLTAEQKPLIKKYYRYGFGAIPDIPTTVHTISNTDVEAIQRWSLGTNTVSQTLAEINSCIAQNGFMCFYGHYYPATDNNLTEANMRNILSTLKTKVDNYEIIVDIPRKAISNYYAVRQSDYKELYEALNP